MVLWFTGLSGAGKSTIAQLVVDGLRADGQHAVLLDGDELRRGLTNDLGFSDADRAESVRRAAEVARLMTDAGLLVAVALISPFRRDRALARGLFAAGQFLEIFVDTSLEVAEARDVKGLYRRARLGLLPAFTGIDSPYEPPLAPDIHIATALVPAHEAAALIVAAVPARPAGVFAGHQPKSGHE